MTVKAASEKVTQLLTNFLGILSWGKPAVMQETQLP